MSREVFMGKLENLLADVTVEEREEALQYYADYFADAGPENEAQVLQELGSPERVAAMIKASLKGGTEEGAFTEHGFLDERFDKKATPATQEVKEEKQKKSQDRYSYHEDSGKGYAGEGNSAYGRENQNTSSQTGGTYGDSFHTSDSYGNTSYYGNAYEGNYSYRKKREPWSNGWLKVLLAVLIIVIGAPVVIPVAAACILTVLGILCGVFGLFLGLVICASAIVIAGIGIACAGITKLIAVPAVALMTMGIGILVTVIGLVATAAAVRLCIIIYPAMWRILAGICRKPFCRKAGI